MGKNKSKEEENEASASASASASDIFKTLFKASNEQNPLPLFSDNPYRRKPQQTPVLGFVSENPSHGVAEENPRNPNFLSSQTDLVDPKKRKREKRRKSDIDSSDSEIERKKKRTFDDGSIEKIDEESETRKNKKKRKRNEIEEEYEARKLGGAVEKRIEGKETKSVPVVGEKRKTADDSAEMVVSKEGFDDESKLQRTVFVGNLPLKMKRKALLKEFKQFGEIESVRIRSVPILDTKMPRKGAIIKGNINDSIDSVNAYIVFKEEQSVLAALLHNMTQIGDKHIRVDRACPPRKKLKGDDAPLYDNKRTIFVGNLPFDVKDEELYQLFCGVNQLGPNIEAIRVIRDPNTSLGKGIAYVMFKTREGLQDAANLVVKKKKLKLRDRDLRLCHSRPDSTPSKRKNPMPSGHDSPSGKRLAVDSNDGTPNSSKHKVRAASLSYQGLRASKSGVQKKVSYRPRTEEHSKSESSRQGGLEPKLRNTKRPAVAARKAKEIRLAAEGRKGKSEGGSARQMGKKRKLETRTPENSHRFKKARKFK
ncbi:hypothetical protein MRB53_027199 [Persea americana]|uniref:Uncharacterized protein n=1 Tax=Persea americana TaxID=3435 RepID=A0ACC2LKF3_PERAE|nr:hypothetical protein MRB53_027199 [Persea americana]